MDMTNAPRAHNPALPMSKKSESVIAPLESQAPAGALGLGTGSAPNWRMAMHISGPTMRSLYRDNKLGVQMERWCKRREGNGPMGYTYSRGGVAHFIDGDKTEYKTEAAMLAALDELRALVLPSGSDENLRTAREKGRVILAHGEVTGHAHAIAEPGHI